MSVGQERELAIFKNVQLRMRVRPPKSIWSLGSHSYISPWIADLHLAESRIYATPNDRTKESDVKDVNQFTVDWTQIIRLWIGKNSLSISWKGGSHFPNREIIDFQITDETFDHARRVLPSIVSLEGKIKWKDRLPKSKVYPIFLSVYLFSIGLFLLIGLIWLFLGGYLNSPEKAIAAALTLLLAALSLGFPLWFYKKRKSLIAKSRNAPAEKRDSSRP